MNWISTADRLPSGIALVWSGGRHRLAVLVDLGGGGRECCFMDPETDALLPWPTHWAELPAPPSS